MNVSKMNTKSENLFDEKLTKLLEKVAKANGFKDYEIKKLGGSTKGDGYVGIINSARIVDKDDNSKVLNLILKCLPKSEELRKVTKLVDVFYREVFMYEMALKTFREFEAEKGLLQQEFAPLLYSALMDDKFETLVLQDLKSINYEMYERRIPMTEDHLRLVLTQYGRLHALSYALRDQKPENWKALTVGLNDVFVSSMLNSGFVKNLIQQCKNAQNAFNKDEEGAVLSAYTLFVEDIQPFFEGLVDCVDDYSVILHGDCWTNNMMFKYEDQTHPSKPTSVRFFDYQISRMGSPAIDLSYFFYTCCPPEALANLDDYLQVYYKSFSNYLRQLGSDPEEMYPYAILVDHWKKLSKFGLMMSMMIIHVMLTEPDEARDMVEATQTNELSTMLDYKIRKSDIYYKRVKPIIEHFVERKFI